MMMATYTLTIPGWHPPKCNEWRNRHWSIAHRLRCRTEGHVGTAALVERTPPAIGKRRVKLILTGWASGGPFPDRDAHDKLLLDALTACGLILGDNPNALEGRVEVEYQRGPKQTQIVLEDVP
jgi:hypothetical protein